MKLNGDLISRIWYIGFILTSGLSLVLSVLLFTSVADSRLSWLILMGIAVALELGKIVTINDDKRSIAYLLIGVSILGSAGGLNRSLSLADDGLILEQQQRDSLQMQIGLTRQAMEQNQLTLNQNNASIDEYIQLRQIRNDARPLQAENKALQKQQAQLQVRLNSLQNEMNDTPQPDLPELLAVLSLLATILALPLDWVQAAVILLLACLLDALTVSFIKDGILLPDGDLPEPEKKQPEADDIKETKAPGKTLKPESANVTAMDNSYPAFRRMMLNSRDNGEEVKAQRACIRDHGLRDRQVRAYFKRLNDEGVIEKNGGQFVWKKEIRNRQLFT